MNQPTYQRFACLLGLVFGQTPMHAQDLRIVGGDHAAEGEYPWMVEMLFLETEHLCGATLIHPRWVLTAGHCALVGDGADMRLLANSINNTTAPGAFAEELEVDTIFYHPDYDGTYGPDLALIRLVQPATTAPVPLLPPAVSGLLDAGDPALALGWGNADTLLFGPSDTLRAVIVPLVDFTTCEALYVGSSSDLFTLNGTTGLLCAAGAAGAPAMGSGNGDSGGPLLVEHDGEWHQAGVVYGGEGQYATAVHPGVYTSVPYHWTWIQTMLNDMVDVPETPPVADVHLTSVTQGIQVTLSGAHRSGTVEFFSVDGRLLAGAPLVSGTTTIGWPGEQPLLIARITGSDGRPLFSGLLPGVR